MQNKAISIVFLLNLHLNFIMKGLITRSSLFLALFLGTYYSYSQSANVRGFVYTKDNGEPVLFTNVYMKGTTYGASTDVNGFFSITKLPPGTYTLLITYLGYDSLKETITVKAGELVDNNMILVHLGAIQK